VTDTTIVRRVCVDQSQSLSKALDATGRKRRERPDWESVPCGEGYSEVEVVFFRVGRGISLDDMEKEYERRGLTPADPQSLAKVNEDDPAFADYYPNGTQWKDVHGAWCTITFCSWDGWGVIVDRSNSGWNGGRWLAGIRGHVPATET